MRAGWRSVASVIGASLLCVLVGWAALVGPDRVLTGPGPTSSTPSTSSTATPPQAPEGQVIDDEVLRAARDVDPPLWLTLLVWTLELAILVGAAMLAVYLMRRAWEAWTLRREQSPPRLEREFDVLTPPERMQRAVRADAYAQDQVLGEGNPRNGIVAAWHRFEVQAGQAGVVRRDWETSSEFTLRFLDLAEADSAAVGVLAQLYREARFSDHHLDESHRGAAMEALARIRTSMGA